MKCRSKIPFIVSLILAMLSPMLAQAEVPFGQHEVPFITNYVNSGESATFSDSLRSKRTGVIKLGEGTLTVKNEDVNACMFRHAKARSRLLPMISLPSTIFRSR